MDIKVAMGKDNTRKDGIWSNSTWAATFSDSPDSATLRTRSKMAPTDNDTAVKAPMPNNRGPSSSPNSQRSIRGMRRQALMMGWLKRSSKFIA